VRQFELDFEGGLTDRFPAWDDVVRYSVETCGRQQRAVAADLDMSPSELSRKLARRTPDRPDEPNFPFYRIPDLIHATGSLLPIYWLVEKFCDDPEAKRRMAIAQIPALVEKLQALVREAKP
jgi:hypothetical protein